MITRVGQMCVAGKPCKLAIGEVRLLALFAPETVAR